MPGTLIQPDVGPIQGELTRMLDLAREIIGSQPIL